MPEEKLASRWLVSTDWLAPHLNDPNVVVLDWLVLSRPITSATQRPSFSPAISRARSASTSTRSRTSPIPCPTCCPRRSSSPQQVGALGVGDGMTIVLYDGIGLYGAARVWWTFRAFGVGQCARARWRHAEVESREPPARDRPGQAARAENVHAEIQSYLVAVDRRRAEGPARQDRAGGRRARRRALPRRSAGAARRAARRPHAGLASTCRSAKCSRTAGSNRTREIAAAFKQAGVDLDKPVVTSCGSGVTAAILTFAVDALGKAARPRL